MVLCVLIFLIQTWILFIGDIKSFVLYCWSRSAYLCVSSLLFLLSNHHTSRLSAAGSLLPLLNSWTAFITAFAWFSLLSVVLARSQPKLQPNDAKCKISSRSVSRYCLELLTITYITDILLFGRESLLFRAPLGLWKFAASEDSATFLIKFFFIGNYPFLNLLLRCLIFIFSSALVFSISESQPVT